MHGLQKFLTFLKIVHFCYSSKIPEVSSNFLGAAQSVLFSLCFKTDQFYRSILTGKMAEGGQKVLKWLMFSFNLLFWVSEWCYFY